MKGLSRFFTQWLPILALSAGSAGASSLAQPSSLAWHPTSETFSQALPPEVLRLAEIDEVPQLLTLSHIFSEAEQTPIDRSSSVPESPQLPLGKDRGVHSPDLAVGDLQGIAASFSFYRPVSDNSI